MAIEKTRGIILQSRDFTETSKLVSFLTPDWGQVKVLAKGARRPESSLRGKLELFRYGILIFYPSRSSDLNLLSQFDVLRPFTETRDTLEKASLFYYFAELVISASYGTEQSQKLFELLLDTLVHSRQIHSISLAQLWFELKFLRSLGVLPLPGHCSHCGKGIEQKIFFSPQDKGWLCSNCVRRSLRASPLEAGVVAAVSFMLRSGLERAAQLKLSAAQEKSLRGMIRYLVDSHLDKKLKSLRFFKIINFPAESLYGFSDAHSFPNHLLE